MDEFGGVEATDIFSPEILSKLVAETDDVETIGNELLSVGYSEKDRDIVTKYITQNRTSKTAAVAPQEIQQPEAPTQPDISETTQLQEAESTRVDVLPPDVVQKLADEPDDLETISNELAASGYSPDDITEVTKQVEAIRSSKVVEPEIANPDIPEDTGSLFYAEDDKKFENTTEEYEDTYQDSYLTSIPAYVGQNLEDTKAAFSRPSDIAASVRNMHSRNAQLPTAMAASWFNNAEARESIAKDHKELNTMIVAALKANDINVTGIAGVDPMETAEGTTQYGDIIYEEDGVKHKVTQTALHDMYKSKFELVGAIGAGMVAGSKVPGPPWLKFLGAIGGGGAGAFTFAGIDAVNNAWDAKLDLDAKVVVAKMFDAGVGDAALGIMGIGAGKIVAKTVKGTAKVVGGTAKAIGGGSSTAHAAYRKITAWMRSPGNAMAAIRDTTKHNKTQMSEMVDKYNELKGTSLNRKDPKDIVKAYMELEPRITPAIVAAVNKSESSGLLFKEMIKKEGDQIEKLIKTGKIKGVATEISNRLVQYGKNTSKFYKGIEEVGIDFVNDAISKGKVKYQMSVGGQLDSLMNRLQQTSNLDNENLVQILKARIENIKRLGSFKTSNLAKSEGVEKLAKVKGAVKSQKASAKAEVSAGRLERQKISKQFADEVAPINKEIQEKQRVILDKRTEMRNLGGSEEDMATRELLRNEITELDTAVKYAQNDLKKLKNKRGVEISTDALQSVQSKDINERLTNKLLGKVEETELNIADEIAKAFENSDGGFADLLALKKALSALGRDSKLVENIEMRNAIKAMEKSVGQEIETVSKEYMGENAEAWLKNHKEANIEWASYSRLKENNLYKTMVNTDKSGYKALLNEGFASMDVASRKYAEVADRLTPAQRKGFENALINKVYENNTAFDAVDWTKFSGALNEMKLRTGDGQGLRAVAKKMAANFGDRTRFGRVLQEATTESSSTGIGTSIYTKAAQQLINTSFKSMRAKIGFTKGNKQLALVDVIADVLENPFNASNIHKMVKGMDGVVPERAVWSMARQLQDGFREFGSLKRYGQNTKIYGRVGADGKLQMEKGVQVAGATEDVMGKGRIKAFDVAPESIQSTTEVNELLKDTLRRPVEVKDLTDPRVLTILEDNFVNGVEIGNKTYMLEHWNP